MVTLYNAPTMISVFPVSECPELTKIPKNVVSVPYNLVQELLLSTYLRSVGTRVTVRCDTGFELQGPAEIQCLSSGKWSAQPSCIMPNSTSEVVTVKDEPLLMIIIVLVVVFAVTIFIVVICVLLYRNRYKAKLNYWSDKSVYQETSSSYKDFSYLDGPVEDLERSITNVKRPGHPPADYDGTLTRQYVAPYIDESRPYGHVRRSSVGDIREQPRAYDYGGRYSDIALRPYAYYHPYRSFNNGHVSNTNQSQPTSFRQYDDDRPVSYIHADGVSARPGSLLWRGLTSGSLHSWSIPRPIYDS